MTRFCSIGIKINSDFVTLDDFRTSVIIPICGEENATTVINNLYYQLFSAGFSKEAKDTLMHYDKSVNSHYIEYDDFGIYMKMYCTYYDKICIADIVEYNKMDPQPP